MRTWFGSVLIGALLAGPAAATELKFITIEAEPWASVDPATHKAVGYFPNLVHELERRTGYKITMTLSPYARIDHELESGLQDCTVVIITKERSRIAKVGEQVSSHPLGVIARKGVPLHSYADLKSLSISVLRGADILPKFDGDSSLKKEFDTDYVTGLLKISHKRVDAVAGSIPTIRFLAQQKGLADTLGDNLVLNDVPISLQCSNRSKHLADMPKLNQAIKAMRTDGTLDKLAKGE